MEKIKIKLIETEVAQGEYEVVATVGQVTQMYSFEGSRNSIFPLFKTLRALIRQVAGYEITLQTTNTNFAYAVQNINKDDRTLAKMLRDELAVRRATIGHIEIIND